MILTRSILKRYSAFQLEELRSKLAREKRYRDLLKTYSRYYAEIKDNNTSRLWDVLNVISKKCAYSKDPMSHDRVRYVIKRMRGEEISVLDVGFGSASLEESFFTNNNKMSFIWEGIDISALSVTRAQKRFPLGKFRLGSILDIRSDHHSYDYVIALEVLEHIRPRHTFKALSELWRVTKSGGFVIVSVPLNEGLEELLKSGINPNAHVRIYSADLIKAELLLLGFKIVDENFLYAFNSFYRLKTFLVKHVLRGFRSPNNVVVVAQKFKQKI